jgi:hypothetical protein
MLTAVLCCRNGKSAAAWLYELFQGTELNSMFYAAFLKLN